MAFKHQWLTGLRFYENDWKLQSRLPSLILEWIGACPDVDLKSELQWSHAWQVSNGRKKNNVRFLMNWMRTAQRYAERRSGDRRVMQRRAPELPKPPVYDVPEEEIMTAEDFQRLKEAIKRKVD